MSEFQRIAETGLITAGDSNTTIGLVGSEFTYITLPKPYEYDAFPDAVEVAALLRDHYPDPEIDVQSYAAVIAGLQGMGLIEAAVRDETGNIVGYGNIIRKEEIGIPTNFVVHGNHAGKKIGKWILDKRIELAENGEIETLWIPFIERTNTLLPYYLQRGFQFERDGELVRGQGSDKSAIFYNRLLGSMS